jgi:hypothetical protein
VRQQCVTLPDDSDADDTPRYTIPVEHPMQREGTHQASRAEDPAPRCAVDSGGDPRNNGGLAVSQWVGREPFTVSSHDQVTDGPSPDEKLSVKELDFRPAERNRIAPTRARNRRSPIQRRVDHR